jgi:hypothetical protein
MWSLPLKLLPFCLLFKRLKRPFIHFLSVKKSAQRLKSKEAFNLLTSIGYITPQKAN